MRERGRPRLTGAAAYIDAGRGAAWRRSEGRRACGLGRVSTRKDRAPTSRLPPPAARLRGSRLRVAARLPHWGHENVGVRFGIRNGWPLGRSRLSGFRRAGRRDSSAANSRRRPYGTVNGCHTGAGFYHPVTAVREPLPYRMDAKQRRACEPVAMPVAAVSAMRRGCHTGNMKTSACASESETACRLVARDFRGSDALADVIPLRQTSGGDRTVRPTAATRALGFIIP